MSKIQKLLSVVLVVLTALVVSGVSVATAKPAATTTTVEFRPDFTSYGERPSARKTIFTTDTGSKRTFTSCYRSKVGPDARAAMAQLVITGDFTPEMVGYLGEEDSELVSYGLHLHRVLSGEREPREVILDGAYLSCLGGR